MLRPAALAILATLLLSAPAGAATTIVPDRLDDPPAGTDCSPGHAAGTCSLRKAVVTATDGDTVALGAGTYELASGELLVANDVSIAGAGPGATTIKQTTAKARVLEFDLGTTGSMSDLTITGGNVAGADGSAGTIASP